METYTIRPAGRTAWATVTGEREAIRSYREAVSRGLDRVMIVRDRDNKLMQETATGGSLEEYDGWLLREA